MLTRTTAILAAVFFLTSLALTILPRVLGTGGSILDTVPGVAPAAPTSPNAPIGTGQGGVLDLLKKNTPAGAGETAPAGAVQTPPAATPAPASDAAPAATTPAAPAATAPAATTPAAPATTAPAAHHAGRSRRHDAGHSGPGHHGSGRARGSGAVTAARS